MSLQKFVSNHQDHHVGNPLLRMMPFAPAVSSSDSLLSAAQSGLLPSIAAYKGMLGEYFSVSTHICDNLAASVYIVSWLSNSHRYFNLYVTHVLINYIVTY